MRKLITLLALVSALAVLGAVGWVFYETRELEEAAESVATLSGVYNEVQWRRAKTLVWEDGAAGVDLRVRDVVRTEPASRAVVEYHTGLVLNVDPRSLIVITAPRLDERGREVQEVIVEAGGVAGELRGGGNGVVNIVEKDGSIAARLTPVSAAGEALRYRFRRGKTGSGEIAILEGSAEVEVGGETVSLSAGQAVDARSGQVRRLPAFPASIEPEVDAQLVLSPANPEVVLRWGSVPEADRYHLQIGRTFAFDDLLVEERTRSTEYRLRPRVANTWYWRVSSIDKDGVEGEFGFARRFSVLSVPDTPPVAVPVPGEGEGPGESVPEVAVEEVFDFRARVLGSDLERQSKGRGKFRRVTGNVTLNAKDVLQTERGAAVRIGKDSTLAIDGGGSVALMRAGSRGGGRVLAVLVSEGTLTADLGGKNATLASVIAEARGARITVNGEGERGARARTELRPGRIRVIAARGPVEVVAAGERVVVPAGHAVEIPDGNIPGSLVKLLPAPIPVRPTAGQTFLTLDSPPPVEFVWTGVEGASKYHIVVSIDPEGMAAVYEGEWQVPNVTYSALKPGKYYWSVRAADAAGFEGPGSESVRFTVYKDTSAPTVRILSPEDGASVGTASVTVQGRTEASARVKVNGKPVSLDAGGSFAAEVRLAPGLNQIVIEAVDRANNVTFKNLKVRKE